MMTTEPMANLSCLRFMRLPLRKIRQHYISPLAADCAAYNRRMKRYPMFDPPEYVGWKPSPRLIEEYQSTLECVEERSRIVSDLSQNQLLDMYAGMLRFRLHDITLRRWVKQGILAKAWL